MPWEHRIGTVGSRYSEGVWSAVTFGHFAPDDCGLRSAALTYNPTSIDANFPQRFSDVVWLPSADARARVRLEQSEGASTNRADECRPGGECDALANTLLLDEDGTLLGIAPSNGGGVATPIDFPAIADETCDGRHGHFACAALRLRWLSWEAPGILAVQTGRELGRFKAWREAGERASWSRGPYGDTCLPSVPEQIRTWAVSARGGYNLTMFASPPKNMRLHLFDEAPSSALRFAIFLTQPFRLDVYLHGEKLSARYDASDAAQFGGGGAPRYPTAADEHGTYAFDPHQRRFYVTMRGGADRLSGRGALLLRASMVVQLSLTAAVPLSDFDGPSLVYNLATLLRIDPTRIKIVAVQSAPPQQQQRPRGVRALAELAVPSTSVLVQIAEPQTEPDGALLLDGPSADGNGTGRAEEETFSHARLAELRALAEQAWRGAQDGQGFWANVSMLSHPELSDPFAQAVGVSPPPSAAPLGEWDSAVGGGRQGGVLGERDGPFAPRGSARDDAAAASLALTRYVVPIIGTIVLLAASACYAHGRYARRAADRAQVVELMDEFDPVAQLDGRRPARAHESREQRRGEARASTATPAWSTGDGGGGAAGSGVQATQMRLVHVQPLGAGATSAGASTRLEPVMLVRSEDEDSETLLSM